MLRTCEPFTNSIGAAETVVPFCIAAVRGATAAGSRMHNATYKGMMARSVLEGQAAKA